MNLSRLAVSINRHVLLRPVGNSREGQEDGRSRRRYSPPFSPAGWMLSDCRDCIPGTPAQRLRSLRMPAVHRTTQKWTPRHPMIYDLVFFIALLATALALGGALAHALELPNKISLSRDEYFIVQKAYRGWNQLAYLLAIQLISMITLAVMSQ